MRNQRLFFFVSILSVLGLTLIQVYLDHEFINAQNFGHFIGSSQDYFYASIRTILRFIAPSILLGIIVSVLFKLRKKRFLFIGIFIFTASGYLLFLCTQIFLKTKSFEKYESNEAYNKSLINSHSGYLATCLNLIIQDIQNQGNKPNDFRVRQIGFEEAMTTIPQDTVEKSYVFDVVYMKLKTGEVTQRHAFYKINFQRQLFRIFDFGANDKTAKVKIDSLMKHAGPYQRWTFY
ncbi:MAG: hypothetical protein EOO46_20270 [Flavobacterium sp.]|nr:MAG: hypothetical protein EOO46_20270 [Flavobacterium sp.]